jgi:hypothetical protein
MLTSLRPKRSPSPKVGFGGKNCVHKRDNDGAMAVILVLRQGKKITVLTTLLRLRSKHASLSIYVPRV